MSSLARQAVIERVRAIVERVVSSEGIEVVDVELLGGGNRRLLRISIDKPGGVTHADCEFVSREVGTILDVEDAVPGGSYVLEVSSPGVERKLTRPRDFERFLGRKARIVLREPVENRRAWEGVLAAFHDGVVTLESSGRPMEFRLDQLERAHLKFDW